MISKLSMLFVGLFPIYANSGTVPELPVVKDTGCKYYFSQTLKKNIYTQTDIEPKFPGEAAAYFRFLNRNLRYPQEMIDNDISPSPVIIKFVVLEDGQLVNPTVQNQHDTSRMTSWEKEVHRILKLMPKWTPGKCNGKIVATEVTTPMTICLETEG